MNVFVDRFAETPWLNNRNQVTAMAARVRGPFAMTTRAHRRPRVHLIDEAVTVWRRGIYKRLAIAAKCGRDIVHARAYMEAPEDYDLCDACIMADFSGPCVYRLLAPGGYPLYIGCSTNLYNRIGSHMCQPWWPLVASVDFEEYPTLGAALIAEAKAIAEQLPHFNRDLSGIAKRPPHWRKAIGHGTKLPLKAVTP